MHRTGLKFLIISIFFNHNFIYANVIPELHEPFDVLHGSNELLRNMKYTHSKNYMDYEIILNCTTYATEQEFTRLENGSLFIPHQKKILDHNSYFVRNFTAYFCKDNPEMADPITHNFNEKFTTCDLMVLDPEEYNLLRNGSIHIEVYARTYDPDDFLVFDGVIYICMPPFAEMKENASLPMDGKKFSETSDYVTFVGLLISIISLVSHLAIFCLEPTVRNLPGCCLASLSLALLLAYLCFLVAFLMKSEALCTGLGMCVYYFFLTSFFWMNTIAFDVWRSFRVVIRELRISSHKLPRLKFLVYSLYSWAVPAVLALLVKLFDSTEFLPMDYRPSFGKPYCWFGSRKALLIFFAVPLIVVMLLNIFFFTDVIYVINRATMRNVTAQEANLRKRFTMFTRLALIMGLTWVFGVAAGFANLPFLWYIFIILNTLQGLFIFAVFIGSSKVRKLCFKKYKNRVARNSTSTSARTMSEAL